MKIAFGNPLKPVNFLHSDAMEAEAKTIKTRGAAIKMLKTSPDYLRHVQHLLKMPADLFRLIEEKPKLTVYIDRFTDDSELRQALWKIGLENGAPLEGLGSARQNLELVQAAIDYHDFSPSYSADPFRYIRSDLITEPMALRACRSYVSNLFHVPQRICTAEFLNKVLDEVRHDMGETYQFLRQLKGAERLTQDLADRILHYHPSLVVDVPPELRSRQAIIGAVHHNPKLFHLTPAQDKVEMALQLTQKLYGHGFPVVTQLILERLEEKTDPHIAEILKTALSSVPIEEVAPLATTAKRKTLLCEVYGAKQAIEMAKPSASTKKRWLSSDLDL